MTTLPLPQYSGRIGDDYHIWLHKFFSWLLIHDVPDEEDARRLDMLCLSLEKGSLAELWFFAQPFEARSDCTAGLNLLKARFGGVIRSDLARQSAINSLASRAFRDEQHCGESVRQLIDEFEILCFLARIDLAHPQSPSQSHSQSQFLSQPQSQSQSQSQSSAPEQVRRGRERKELFVRLFRRFPAASRMLQRTTSLEVAFQEAMRWERMMFSSGENTPSL